MKTTWSSAIYESDNGVKLRVHLVEEWDQHFVRTSNGIETKEILVKTSLVTDGGQYCLPKDYVGSYEVSFDMMPVLMIQTDKGKVELHRTGE